MSVRRDLGMHSGHDVYPDGIISCAVPQEYHSRESCTLAELLKVTLVGDNRITRLPEVIAVSFSNMYEEGGHDWWCTLRITGVHDNVDLSSCVEWLLPESDASYKLTSMIVHRHSGPARRSHIAGHYVCQFLELGEWYMADDTLVRKCEPLRSMQGSTYFPYVLFLKNVANIEGDICPMQLEHRVDDFVLRQLEVAPHLEFDAVLLSGLSAQQRGVLSNSVDCLLEGLLYDELSLPQRRVLHQCSPIIQALGSVDSSSEHRNQARKAPIASHAVGTYVAPHKHQRRSA